MHSSSALYNPEPGSGKTVWRSAVCNFGRAQQLLIVARWLPER